MCTDIVYQGHTVACIQSDKVKRIDDFTFCIGDTPIEFWDAMHMTVIGEKSVIEIPPDKVEQLPCLIARKAKLQNQIELLSALIAQTEKQISKLKGAK